MAEQQSELESNAAAQTAAHDSDDNASDADAHEKRRAPRSGRGLAWLALLIALLALAAGGYLWERQRHFAAALSAADARRAADGFDDAIAQLAARIDQAEQSTADLAAQLDALRDALQAQKQAQSQAQPSAAAAPTAQAQRIESLRGEVARLSAEVGRGASRWHLREAEQWMVIANQQLLWSADAALAAHALQLADDRLRRIYDPALAPVRAHLADELVALGNVQAVDVAGTLNALAALANGVDALPLAGDALLAGEAAAIDDAREAEPRDDAEDAAPWWHLGDDLLADLGALVQVETDRAAPLVIEHELRWMTFERAKLLLESAQLAFLRARDDVYTARMARARDWIVARFDIEAAPTIAWLQRFDALAATPPSARLPDISASLRHLRAVLQRE